MDELVSEIATASSEQHQGIAQVNTAVSQMDKVTQSNAGSAEESAAAAEELNAQATSMQQAVGDLRKLVTRQAGESSSKSSSQQDLAKTRPTKKLRLIPSPSTARTAPAELTFK
jgi:uncharacterized phage infection (PIP) family protein YhgE